MDGLSAPHREQVMFAITLALVLFVLLVAFLAGFAWTVGCWLASVLLGAIATRRTTARRA